MVRGCPCALLAIAVIALAGACRAGNGSGSFPEGTCTLPTPQPCMGCIDFSLVTRLGSDPDEDGYLVANTVSGYLVRDGAGRYWVGQRDHLKLFGPSGTFLGRLGHQGQGPLEFFSAYPFAVDGSGQVHVFDNLNGRVTVLGHDLTLSDESRIPVFTTEMAVLSDARRYVLSAWIPGAASAGYPIHLLDMGEITASFGALADSLAYSDPLEPVDAERLIAIDSSDAIFAARPWHYTVDAWDTNGMRLGRVEGPKLDDGQRAAPGPYSKANPPWNGIWDIRVDRSGLLWIIVNLRRADWDDQVTETIAPDGTVSLQGRSDDIYRSRLDVVDPKACTFVSSSWFDGEGILSSFVHAYSHTTLVGQIVRSDFTDPVVNIWRPELR